MLQGMKLYLKVTSCNYHYFISTCTSERQPKFNKLSDFLAEPHSPSSRNSVLSLAEDAQSAIQTEAPDRNRSKSPKNDFSDLWGNANLSGSQIADKILKRLRRKCSVKSFKKEKRAGKTDLLRRLKEPKNDIASLGNYKLCTSTRGLR